MRFVRRTRIYRITIKRQSSANMRGTNKTYKNKEKSNVHGDSPDRCVVHFEANDVKQNLNGETNMRLETKAIKAQSNAAESRPGVR